MITLDELKKKKDLEIALTITFEDHEKLSKETRQQMQGSPYVIVSFPSDFAFNCRCCEDAAPELNPYRIVKEHSPKIIKMDKIFPINSLESEPEFDSKLNYVKCVGYVCDHCRESVFEGADMSLIRSLYS